MKHIIWFFTPVKGHRACSMPAADWFFGTFLVGWGVTAILAGAGVIH